MKMSHRQTVTRLLQNYQEGDKGAVNELFELLYRDLYKIACGHRGQWQQNDTLNSTALLHETYLKLAEKSHISWESRDHFMATASRVMRHILINYARESKRIKRGGEWQRVTLAQLEFFDADKESLSVTRMETLVLLDKALTKLDKINPRQSRIVECRVFGGLTIKETATALEISPITVTRGWKTARLWLCREIESGMEF
jgi:RNA polymerase sigma factor (TIGR02999 family)